MSYWIFIERQYHPHVVLGPFQTEKQADDYQNSSDVDDICTEDALSCDTATDPEKIAWIEAILKKKDKWIHLYPDLNLLL